MRRSDPRGDSLRRRPGGVAGIVVALGLVITVASVWYSWQRGIEEDAVAIASKAEVLVFDTLDMLEDASAQMTAAGSLFRASDYVSPDEFQRFVSDMGLLTGVVGIGWVPIVPHDGLEDWLRETQQVLPDFEVFDLDDVDNRVPVGDRDVHFPLVYFAPLDLFSRFEGLDLGFAENWYNDLVDASGASGVTMTQFVDIGLPAPLDDGDQFAIGWPIADVTSGAVDALAIAVLDLGLLVDSNISAEVIAGIDWSVHDVTGHDPQPAASRTEWRGTLDYGARSWQFAVTSTQASSGLATMRVLAPLFGGSAIVLLLGAAIQLWMARTTGRQKVHDLELLNRSKDDFLAAVSHRLRTPLTAVVGFSEILSSSDSGLTEIDRRELLSTIAVQAIELGHLFDNLLTVSRDSHRAHFAPTRVNLATELYAVLDTAEPSRRVKIRVAGADPEAATKGDPALVRQVLRNLIANAAFFGRKVEITVVGNQEVGRVVVRDDGPGIPADRVHRLFELYHHAGEERGQPESMGVGLFVSRRLARRMGGDVTYRRDGSWTVFELSLPLVPAADSLEQNREQIYRSATELSQVPSGS